MSIGNLKDYGNKGNNFPWQLKVLQGLQAIASSTNAPLTCVDQVTVCGTTFSDIEGVSALNVNVINPIPLEVIINEVNDSILVYGFDGTTNRKIKTDAAGSVSINDGGNSITVDGSVSVTGEVEIINAVGSPIPVTVVAPVPVINVNLDAADDQVGVYGYINGVSSTPTPLNVNATGQVAIQDGGNSITVDAVDLDIRNLDCATDSVSICAGGAPLTSTTITTTTALDVNIVPTNTVLNLQNLEVSGADGDLSSFGSNITSISFFSNGTANALVSVNGGASFVNVAPGTTINLDANSPSNAYGGTSFFWDTTTNLGSSLIIIYSYI